MSIYTDLESRALPLMEAYREDLTKHDRNQIERHPETPFLHFTRNHGTHLVHLHPANLESYFPARDVRVPYLFGTADRTHILDQMVKTVEWCVACEGRRLILDFNGRELAETSGPFAIQKIRDYARNIARQWVELDLNRRGIGKNGLLLVPIPV